MVDETGVGAGHGAARLGVAQTVILLALGTAMLSAVTVANGYPFFFNDTADYILTGRDIVSTLQTRLFDVSPSPPAGASPTAGPPTAPSDPMALTYMASRSAYFSLLTAAVTGLMGLWGPVLLQGLAAAWILWLLVRVVAPPHAGRAYLATVSGLVVASSLPFFVGFLMPDIYAGLGIAAVLMLILYVDRLTFVERGLLFGLAAAAGAFHTSTWVVLLCTALAAALALLWTGRGLAHAVRRGAIGLAAALTSALAVMAYGLGVQAFYGAKIDNPPFLMARALEDGPGRAYLHASCQEKQWVICDYRRLALDDASQILWDPAPATGVFFPASYATRRRLNAEETAFVIGSTRHSPLAQAAASTRNALETLVSVRVSPEFGNARQVWRDSLVYQITPEQPFTRAHAYRGTFPLQIFDVTNILALVLASGFLAWRLTRSDFRGQPGDAERQFLCAALALAAAVLANAAVCGVASGPFDRYQTRLVWLIPALAMIAAARFGVTVERRKGPTTASLTGVSA